MSLTSNKNFILNSFKQFKNKPNKNKKEFQTRTDGKFQYNDVKMLINKPIVN